MTTLLVNCGGYPTLITIDLTPEQINDLADRTPADHWLTYSQLRGGTSVYNRETGRVEYTGGRLYIGLGAPLGWEIGIATRGWKKYRIVS